MQNIPTSYKVSTRLKNFGMTQDSELYYFLKTKEVYDSKDIVMKKNFNLYYCSAYCDFELDEYLPVGTTILKTKKEYVAKLLLASGQEITGRADRAVDAKAELIMNLIKAKVLKL